MVRKAPPQPGPTDADRLFLAVARDRRAGKLAEDVSEGDLIRRYLDPDKVAVIDQYETTGSC